MKIVITLYSLTIKPNDRLISRKENKIKYFKYSIK